MMAFNSNLSVSATQKKRIIVLHEVTQRFDVTRPVTWTWQSRPTKKMRVLLTFKTVTARGVGLRLYA